MKPKIIKTLVAYYQDNQIHEATRWKSDDFEPWDVSFNVDSKLLEYDLLQRMRNDGIFDKYKYAGLLSHSAYMKLGMDPTYVQAQIKDGIDNDVDLILLNPAIACNAFFKNGVEQGQVVCHSNLNYIFSALGYRDFAESVLPYYSFIMCSYIIAKKKFWDVYFQEVDAILSKAISLAEESAEFQEAYFGDSNYKLKPNRFDYRPFVIERMPQIMLNMNNYKIKYIESTKETFALKFGQNAKLVYTMHKLKQHAHESPAFRSKWDEIRRPFLQNGGLSYKMACPWEFHRSQGQAVENLRYLKDIEVL